MWETWLLGLAIVSGLVVYNALLCRRWIRLVTIQEDIVSGTWHYRIWLARLQQAEHEAGRLGQNQFDLNSRK